MPDIFTEDQIFLGNAVTSFLAAEFPPSAQATDGNRLDWGMLVEQGWQGIMLPSELGGYGGGVLDLVILARALGTGLIAAPLLGSVALVTPALLHCQDRQRASHMLEGALGGRIRIALAHQESAMDPGVDHLDSSARRASGGYRLNGTKHMVLDGGEADWLILSVREDDAGPNGSPSLFVVSTTHPGLQSRRYHLVDGSPAADFEFHDLMVSPEARIADSEDASNILRHGARLGMMTALGEALGCLEGCLSATVEQLNARQQFGKPLSSFQVLRHRVAEMFMIAEEMKAMVIQAAQDEDEDSAWTTIRAAKIFLSRTGCWAAEQAVQLHGAMGITDECVAGRYLKRAIVLDRLFGGGDHHADALGRQIAEIALRAPLPAT